MELGFPSGVAYPLLVLRGTKHINGKTKPTALWLEVDGKINLFIQQKGVKKAKFGHIDVIEYARVKLKEMIKRLSEHKIIIDQVNIYTGSGGPSHFFRNGVLYQRMDEDVENV
jgi:hypothetical protein